MQGLLVQWAVMNNPKPQPSTKSKPTTTQPAPSTLRLGHRELPDPLTYDHPFESMARYAELLALRHDCNRTRHAYYRQLRLIQEHFACDPKLLDENQIREYLLFLKLEKHWKPNTMRQAVACLRAFFHDLLGNEPWLVFSQIRTKDLETLPVVHPRADIRRLLASIRLRRYRTPLKLIYCCGLRLSECLSLTKYDIKGDEGKLIIRQGKGLKDRMVPIASDMLEDLRAYYRFHRNPLLIFPNVGRGIQHGDELPARMRSATTPMPHASLQRLLVVARKELGIPDATVHSLRHSFATHMIESGASLHTVQRLLGHKKIETTMTYLHVTHQSREDTRALIEALCQGLPR
jgi:integrase/recombinase XerD